MRNIFLYYLLYRCVTYDILYIYNSVSGGDEVAIYYNSMSEGDGVTLYYSFFISKKLRVKVEILDCISRCCDMYYHFRSLICRCGPIFPRSARHWKWWRWALWSLDFLHPSCSSSAHITTTTYRTSYSTSTASSCWDAQGRVHLFILYYLCIC